MERKAEELEAPFEAPRPWLPTTGVAFLGAAERPFTEGAPNTDKTWREP